MSKKVLYTGGTFDLYHSGHANFLRQCKSLADLVVVSLNTDEFIQSYKGKKPIMSYEEREKVLYSCRYVDSVVPNVGGADSKLAILNVRPQILAVGDDWAQKDYYKQMQFSQKWLDDNEIVLVYVPYTRGVSTTDIKARLKEYF